MTTVFTPETPAETFTDLVGEGKKFKDVEALTKGKLESDAFIKRLEGEMKSLREELNSRGSLETELNNLKDELKRVKSEPVIQPKEQTAPALTGTDIKALVRDAVTDIEKSRTADQNIQVAHAEMVKKYGTTEKASEVLKKRAAEVNMSVVKLAELAAESPTAFFAILGQDVKSAQTNSGTAFATVPLPQSGTGAQPGTKAYFDEILLKDRRKYQSQDVQKQIWAAVKAGTYEVSS